MKLPNCTKKRETGAIFHFQRCWKLGPSRCNLSSTSNPNAGEVTLQWFNRTFNASKHALQRQISKW
jgi:hypothetical protein